MASLKPYIVTEENAARISDWLRTRGGLAIWESVDFNRLGQTMTTPLHQSDGTPSGKPAYWVSSPPVRIITDSAEVLVSKDVEVKRFHVALRTSSNGLMLKCTEGSSRRVHLAVEKAGDGAYHVFDYASQEAVILKPSEQIPLPEWLATRFVQEVGDGQHPRTGAEPADHCHCCSGSPACLHGHRVGGKTDRASGHGD